MTRRNLTPNHISHSAKRGKGIPSKRCAICRHNDRARIEWLAASGASLQAIAKQYELQYDSLWRHWRNHVSDHRRATLLAGPMKLSELVDVAADEGRSVLDHLHVLRAVVYDALVAASEAGDRNGISALTSRALEILQELGRASGELIRASSGVHVQQNNFFFGSPIFHALETALLDALRSHPEARADVVRALRNLETGTTTPALPAPIEGHAEVVNAATG
jgi:hypothetical protein